MKINSINQNHSYKIKKEDKCLINNSKEEKKYFPSEQCLTNYNINNISFKSLKTNKNQHLDKYVIKNFTPKNSDFYNIYLNELSGLIGIKGDFWTSFFSEDQSAIPWKLHLYADNKTDWLKLCKITAPYLKDNEVSFKTVSIYGEIEELNNTKQKGKAITIYPKSLECFAQTAHDLNYIIKESGLCTKKSKIIGDNELGNSGRLFYRYEYKKKVRPYFTLDLKYKEHLKRYEELYEPNRKDGGYLASDMTIEDDIWYSFNPDIDGTGKDPLRFYKGDLDE